MDYGTTSQLGAGFFLVYGIWSLVGLGVYVWYLWALSRLFPYLGLPSGWGWIPVWNQWQLIQRGGLPGWLALFMLVPGLGIVTLVVSIIAIHRINSEFGKGAGFTVLGAFIPPLWATLFASQLRDREYGDQGYATGGYAADGYGNQGGQGWQSYAPSAPAAGGMPAQPGSGAAPTYGAGGFAPQQDLAQQPDPAWQGLPPVQQVPQQAPQQDAQNPWAMPQSAPGAPAFGAPGMQGVPDPQNGSGQSVLPQQAPDPAAQAQGAPAAPADPWHQPFGQAPVAPGAGGSQQPDSQFGAPQNDAPQARSGQFDGAHAPATNNWGFSNTTEGDFERLAAEGHTPGPQAPLGQVAAPRPFSWPVVEDSSLDQSGPLVLPEPPVSAQAPAEAPAPASPQAPTQPAAPEPSIFDREAPSLSPAPAAPHATPHPTPAQTGEPSEPIAIPNLPEPGLGGDPIAPVAPVAPVASVAPTAPVATVAPGSPANSVAVDATATPATSSGPIEPVAPLTAAPGGLDEDHTVVVSRRTRWGLELPGGETLELEGDDIVIGRKPEALPGTTVLQISDPTRTMSKSHARLRRDGDDWSIEDLHSTNGVSLVDASGDAAQLESGRISPTTEQMVIGTLEVRLRQL